MLASIATVVGCDERLEASLEVVDRGGNDAVVERSAELPTTPVGVVYPFRGRFVPGEGFVVAFDDTTFDTSEDGTVLYNPELGEFAALGPKPTNLGAGWSRMLVGSSGDLRFVTDGSSIHPWTWNDRHTALLDCEAEYGGPYFDSASSEYSFEEGRGVFCATVAIQDYAGSMPLGRLYAEVVTISSPSPTTLDEDWAGYRWPSGNGAYEDHFWYPSGALEREPTKDQWLPEPLPGATQLIGQYGLGLWQYEPYDPSDPDPDSTHPSQVNSYHSEAQWVFGFPADSVFNFSGRVVGHFGEVNDMIDNDWDGALNDGFLCGECCVETSPWVGVNLCNSGIADCPIGSECLNSVFSSIGVCGDIGGEVLDGVDNDCDGVADNNTFCGECCADNTGGFCHGLMSDCPNGWTCQGAGTIGTCVADDPTEIADGIDNDCDGVVDEGLACGSCCFDALGLGGCANSLLPTSCSAGSTCGGSWYDQGTCYPDNGDPC